MQQEPVLTGRPQVLVGQTPQYEENPVTYRSLYGMMGRAADAGDWASVQEGIGLLGMEEMGSNDPIVQGHASNMKRAWLRELNRASGSLGGYEAARDNARMIARDLDANFSGATEEERLSALNDFQLADAQWRYLNEGFQRVTRQPSIMGFKTGDPYRVSDVSIVKGRMGGDPDDAFYMPHEIAERPLLSDATSTMRRFEVLSAPIQKESGRAWVRTQFVDYDIQPYLDRFDTPEVRDRIRKAMTGQQGTTPGSGRNLATAFAGLAADVIARMQGNLGSDESIDDWIGPASTADPRVNLPYTPNLYAADGDTLANFARSRKALRDPARYRAFMEVMEGMYERGDIEKTVLEAAAGMGVGISEFFLVNKGVQALGGKVLGAAAVRTGKVAQALPAIPWMANMKRSMGKMWGFSKSRPYWRGLQFGARDVMEEITYELALGQVHGDSTIAENVQSGFAEGVLEAGLRTAGTGLRKGVGLMGVRNLRPFKRMSEARKRLTNVDALGDRAMSLLPSTNGDLRKSISKAIGEGMGAERLLKKFDALFVGATMGAYESALSKYGPYWDQMSMWEKSQAMLGELDSGPAIGNMLTFAAAGEVYTMGDKFSIGNRSKQQAEEVDRLARSIADDLAHPDAARFMEYAATYDQLRASNPDLFDDIPVMSPWERTTAREWGGYALQDPKVPAKYDDATTAAIHDPWYRVRVTGVQEGEIREGKPTRIPAYTSVGADDSFATLWLHDEGRVAVKQVQPGVYSIVRANDPNQQVQNTALWYSRTGAMAQANHVADYLAGRRDKPPEDDPGGLPFDEGGPQAPPPTQGPAQPSRGELTPEGGLDFEGTQPDQQAAIPSPDFRLTDEYQDVPEGTVLPMGAEVKVDMQTGQQQARRPPPAERVPMEAPASPAKDAAKDLFSDVTSGARVPGDEIQDVRDALPASEAAAPLDRGLEHEQDTAWLPSDASQAPAERESAARAAALDPKTAGKDAPEGAQELLDRERAARAARQDSLQRSTDAPSEGVANFEDFAIDAGEVALSTIGLQPDVFQHKEGTDPTTGVDPKSPLGTASKLGKTGMHPILLYEYADGRRVVADGHQRFGKATELGRATIPAFVLRESDGVTVGQAKGLAAINNIRAGTAQAKDLATVIRELGWTARDLAAFGVDPRRALARQAYGLAKLDPAVWDLVQRGVLKDNYAAEIGQALEALPHRQLQAAKEILKAKGLIRSADQVRAIAQGIAGDAVVMSEQTDMFGDASEEVSIYTYRGLIVDAVLKGIKRQKGAFGQLANNAKLAERIESHVNVELARKEHGELGVVLETVQRLASLRGTVVNQVVGDAAAQLAAGGNKTEIVAETIAHLKGVDMVKDLDVAAAAIAPSPVAQMPQEEGLFGPQDKESTVERPSGEGFGAAQGLLIDDQPGDAPGQQSILDAQETSPSAFLPPDPGGPATPATSDRETTGAPAPPVQPAFSEELPSGLAYIEGARFNEATIEGKRGVTRGFSVQNVSLEYLRANIDPNAFDAGGAFKRVFVHEQHRNALEYITTPPADSAGARLRRALKLEAALEPPRPGGFSKNDSGKYQIDLLDNEAAHPVSTRLRQASVQCTRCLEVLSDLGLIKPDVSLTDNNVQLAIWEIARESVGVGEPALFKRFQAAVGTQFKTLDDAVAAYEAASTAANNAITFMQLAALQGAKGDEVASRALKAYFRASEDMADSGALSDGVKAELKSMGMLDEGGLVVHQGAAVQLGKWNAELMRQAGDRTELHSVNPLMIFGPEAMGEHGLTFLPAKLFQINKFVAMWAKYMPRRIHNTLAAIAKWTSFSGGMLPPAVARINFKSLNDVMRQRKGEQHGHVNGMELGLQRLAWGASLAPREQARDFTEVIRSGAYKTMETADDLVARFGESRRYLWPIIRRVTDLTNAVGIEIAQVGYATYSQIANQFDQYVMHAAIRADKRSIIDQVEAGEYRSVMPGRDLPQGQGYEADLAVTIDYPEHLFMQSQSQESNVVMVFGILQDFAEQGLTPTFEEFNRTDDEGRSIYTPWDRANFQVAALPLGPRDPVPDELAGKMKPATDPINGRRATSFQNLFHRWLSDLKNTTQTREEFLEGKGDGKRPWTRQKQEMIDHYLGVDGEPGAVMTTTQAKELETLFDAWFDNPANDPMDPGGTRQDLLLRRIGDSLDEMTRWWRRAVTVQNPVHWTLARVSDVLTNYALGYVGIGDFVTSVLLGQGVYADSMRHMLRFQEWGAAGKPINDDGSMPDELRAKGWTDQHWQEMMDVNEAATFMMGSTLVASILSSNTIGDIVGAVSRPDQQTQRLAHDIENKLIDVSDTIRLTATVTDMGRRAATGHAAVERRVLEALDSDDVNTKLQGILEWQAMYQTWELFSKYAAATYVRRRHPHMSWKQALVHGARGTADYANTSPHLRQWSTVFRYNKGFWWKATEKAPGLKIAVQMLTATPFMVYDMAMMPAKAAALIRRPHRVAVVAAINLLLRAAIQDDDDEYRDLQILRSISDQAPGQPILTREEAEQLRAMAGDGVLSWLVSGGWLAKEGAEAFTNFFVDSLTMSPHIWQAPRFKGTRTTDTLEFLAPLDQPLKLAQAVRDYPHLSTKAKGRRIFETLEGLIPMWGLSIATGFYRIASPGAGETRMQAFADQAIKFGNTMSPMIHPELWLFNKKTTHALEQSFLEGQTILPWMKSMRQAFPESPEQRFRETMFSTVWKSRALRSSGKLREEADLVQNMLGEIGMMKDPKGPEVKARSDAGTFVARQFFDILEQSYHKWKQFDYLPGDTLDKIVGKEVNLWADLDPEALSQGVYQLKPRTMEGYHSTMASAVSSMPQGQRAQTLEVAAKFLRGPAWQTRGRAVLFDAGRARKLDSTLFRELFRASVFDANGAGLVDYIHEQVIQQGDKSKIGQMAPLFWTITRSSSWTGERLKRFDDLFVTFDPLYDRNVPIEKAMPAAFPVGHQGKALRAGPTARRFLQQQARPEIDTMPLPK